MNPSVKTIKGRYTNSNSVFESILSSTKSGKELVFAEFKKYLDDNYYVYKTDEKGRFSFSSTHLDYSDRSFPVQISDISEIYLDNLTDEDIYLPAKAIKVYIMNCKNLKKLKIFDTTEIETLFLKNCPVLEIDGLKNAKIKKILVQDCGITSISCLENAGSFIGLSNCRQLKTYDLVPKNKDIRISIFNCPVTDFPVEIEAESFSMHDCVPVKKSISMTISDIDSFKLGSIDKLEDLYIFGDKTKELIIHNCSSLKTLYIQPDCYKLLDLVDIKKLKNLSLPPEIKGYLFYKNVGTKKYIKCKKLTEN